MIGEKRWEEPHSPVKGAAQSNVRLKSGVFDPTWLYIWQCVVAHGKASKQAEFKKVCFEENGSSKFQPT